MRRGFVLLKVVSIALTVVPAASGTKPAREVIPAPADMTIAGQWATP